MNFQIYIIDDVTRLQVEIEKTIKSYVSKTRFFLF